MELTEKCLELLAVHGLTISLLVGIYLYAKWTEDKKTRNKVKMIEVRLDQIADYLQEKEKEEPPEEEKPHRWNN
jgi:hypothetical protein